MKKGFVKRYSFLTVAALVLSLFAFTPKADAVTATWICGGTNWWDNASCWDTGIVPVEFEDVNILNSGISDITVDYRNSSTPFLGTLTLDGTGAGTVRLNQSQDHLSTHTEIIGDSGTGEFNQTGGTNGIWDTLHLGFNSGSSGTYNLSGTGTLSAGWESVGGSGTGTFTQTGGTNYVAEVLSLGGYSGSSGTYNLSGGSLTAQIEVIGESGTGVFNQTGGTNSVFMNLYLGQWAGSSGTYNLSGGTLDVVGNIVNGDGTGTLNIDGGTLILGGGTSGSIDVDYFNVGNASGSNGSFTLNSGQSLWAYSEAVGYDGTGVFNQTGGTNNMFSDLDLGHNAGSSGTYNLSGTGTLYTGWETIGGSGTGTFTQTGGTNYVAEVLSLGGYSGSSGTYNLSGGSLTAQIEVIGYYGTGVFNQTGGTNSAFLLDLGPNAGSSGTYNQTGGTNTVIDNLRIAAYAGSSGTYNLSGGTLTVQNAGGWAEIINNDTFNYSGGTLTVDTFTNNADFNLSGAGTRTVNGDVTNTATGTIKTTGTTAVFIGTFTNIGAFISDPSDNYFTNIINTGYFVGGVGDSFFVSGDFFNNSTQGALWDTVDAYLGFNGAGAHEFNLADWLDPESYAWGTMELMDGGGLTLTGGASASLWVGDLILSAGSILDLGGYDLYYTGTFTDYGGTIIGGDITSAVPEPSTVLLLMIGMAGLIAFSRRSVV